MGLITNITLVVERIGAEFRDLRDQFGSALFNVQSEIDSLSDVVATKATEANVNNQLAQKANAADLDNVFGIAIAAVPNSQKGAASGVATLGSDAKLVPEQLPALAITEYLGSSNSEAQMIAKTGQKGDWTTRTDLGTVWIITGDTPSQASSWTQMTYPTAPVTSVAGKTGSVVLAKSDVGLSNVDNTTDMDKPVSYAQQSALDGKLDALNGITGIWLGTKTQYDSITTKDPSVYYVVVA